MISTAEFFSLTDFAVPATVRGRTISVIFDEQYVDALGVESSQPAATCSSADAEGVEQDEMITISGREFRIIGVQPDGTGVTVLRLHKV
jgi:hypothetical protein